MSKDEIIEKEAEEICDELFDRLHELIRKKPISTGHILLAAHHFISRIVFNLVYDESLNRKHIEKFIKSIMSHAQEAMYKAEIMKNARKEVEKYVEPETRKEFHKKLNEILGK